MAYTIKSIIFNRWPVLMLFCVWLLSPASSYAQEFKSLVFRPQGEVFDQLMSGLNDDIGEDVLFTELFVDKAYSSSAMQKALEEHKPNVIVVVGNQAVNVYKKFQAENEGKAFPPSIAVGALFVDRVLTNVKNTTGVRYEVPAVTSAVNLRQLLKTSVKKVGVVHREWMSAYIADNRRFLQQEGIELLSVTLPNTPKDLAKDVARGIKQLTAQDVDAIWVISDNALLKREALLKSWIPQLTKTKLPVIVGVETLLQTKFSLGNFGVLPDHYGLGLQVASIVGDLLDDDWDLGGREIEQPVSVKKIVNLRLWEKQGIKFDDSALAQLDRVIKE